MEAREFRPDPQPHLRLRGAGGLADSEQGLLAALYEARERYARHLDLPPFRVIANDALVGLARRPPADRAGWAKALSPRARRFLEELLAAARRPEAAP
jgi:ribonuclease D